MATKFSQFGSVSPSATTEIVGLDGGLNSKFQVGNIDVSNLTGFPLTILLIISLQNMKKKTSTTYIMYVVF